MTPDELNALGVRVGNGTQWLADHDPGGRFHTWWQAGLTPLSPLPAQEATPEIRAEWTDYFRRRQLWEQLERRLSAAEQRAASYPATVIEWQPAPVRA